MAAKEIFFHQGAREAILRGVRILSDAVAVTLGPGRSNAVIEFGSPASQDGVTVAMNQLRTGSRTWRRYQEVA